MSFAIRLLFWLLLTLPAWAEVELPADIHIKTPTQTFNSRYYYALHEGKIWIRPNRQTTGKDEPWQLMVCKGLPCNPDKRDFAVPAAIKEISADGDELTAIDDKGRFYIRTMAGPGWLSATEWTDLNGFPKGVLKLPERLSKKKAWSMGRRHFDVLWHEDADGNQHHVGVMGTSSIYVLGEKGFEIWFTDNGLPADISHIACGPERGTFVAENLQASAGTLFLIDARGQMYTSMDDFDLNGGTSMFISYTYTPQKRYETPTGRDYASHLKPWRLPLEQWRRQPEIPLTGKARISKLITILQNGQGNAARELRVAGQDAGGRTGYWHKAIFAEQWAFTPAQLQIADSDWLEPAKAANTRVMPQDIGYAGLLSFGPEQTYVAEVSGFNMHCSPARLRLYLPGGPVDLQLHTVDAWVNIKRQDPGRDGSMQLMLGTIEAPEQVLEKLPAELKAVNRSPFKLHVGATTDQLLIFDLDGSQQGVMLRNQPLPPSIKSYNYHFALPPGAFASARLREAGLEPVRTLDPSLVRIDLSAVPADELELLAWYTQETLNKLQKESDTIMAAKQDAWLTAMFATTLRGIYMGTGMCWWMPNGQALCRTAADLLGSYYRLEDDLNAQVLQRYRQMMHQLSFRLERYSARLRELKGPDWVLTEPKEKIVKEAG